MMKNFLATLLVAAGMLPMLSFAQANTPLTRAQVYAQVVQAEKTGTLHTSKVHYPNDVIARDDRAHHAYGASTEGTAQTGWIAKPFTGAAVDTLYKHH
jgi:opacity protein-like surface antigen